ncbi:MFS transporter [Chloroflexota bacterium]
MNAAIGTVSEQAEKAYRKVVNSWAMYDWANSAFVTTIMAAVLPVYYNNVAGETLPGNTATAYWGYTTSIALFIMALLAPILGAIADFSGVKKRLLVAFAAIGVLFSALLYFVTTGDWLMASLFFIVGNIAFAAADLFYNSLLPHVARSEDIDQVSTRGYAFGYLGGGLLLAINVVMIQLMADKALAARLSFVSVSIWWAVFTIPLIRNVKEPPASGSEEHINLVVAGFQRLSRTFREIRHYRQLFLFLIAFWIYNDGIGTIIKMAAIYGAEIGIDDTALIGALLMTQFVGIPFAFGFGWLAKRLGAKRSIYLGLAVYTLISIGGYFLATAWHFWVLAFFVGTVQGGSQALSRSLFGAMSPRAKTAEFFGFYGMSSKFAGIVGPLLFAAIGQMTGSSRLSIVALVIFFIVGGFLLSRVDEKEGIRVAREEDAAVGESLN